MAESEQTSMHSKEEGSFQEGILQPLTLDASHAPLAVQKLGISAVKTPAVVPGRRQAPPE